MSPVNDKAELAAACCPRIVTDMPAAQFQRLVSAAGEYGMGEHDPLMRLEDDPSGGTVHHPYSAFNQGFDAGKAETPISLNPYEEGSREFRWWGLGHEWATCPDPWEKEWG